MNVTQHWNGVLTSLTTSVFDWTSSNFYAKIFLLHNYYSHAVTSIQNNCIHVHVTYVVMRILLDCCTYSATPISVTYCVVHILCTIHYITHCHTHTHEYARAHTCEHAQFGSTVSGVWWYALIWQFLFSMQDDIIMKILKYQGVIYLY